MSSIAQEVGKGFSSSFGPACKPWGAFDIPFSLSNWGCLVVRGEDVASSQLFTGPPEPEAGGDRGFHVSRILRVEGLEAELKMSWRDESEDTGP